ncbi:hypothetical protein [Robinsoniella peoriensis]|uniref:hypothetical protein n=1 Tax=Robinsoniella peoriensis TaxID=180332 RepID=UPI00375018DD
MSGELLKIADGFTLVAEGIRTLAGIQGVEKKNSEPKAGQAVAEKNKKPVEAEPASKKVTVEDIRAVLAQKSQDGKSKEVKALLNKFGVAKLSAVEEKDYPVLLLEAEAL